MCLTVRISCSLRLEIYLLLFNRMFSLTPTVKNPFPDKITVLFPYFLRLKTHLLSA